MASPVVESVTTTTMGSPTSSTITTNMPATVNSGDLLVWAIGLSDGRNVTSFGGSFSELFDLQETSSFCGLATAYKLSSGSESSTYDATLDTNGYAGSAVFRISGAENPGTQLPEYNTSDANTSTPDPPSVTPTGGSDDYLSLALLCHRAADAITGYPSGYGNTGSNQFGTGGAYETLGYGAKAFTGTSEDPGSFTLSATRNHVVATVVIHPAAAGGGGPSINVNGSATSWNGVASINWNGVA